MMEGMPFEEALAHPSRALPVREDRWERVVGDLGPSQATR